MFVRNEALWCFQHEVSFCSVSLPGGGIVIENNSSLIVVCPNGTFARNPFSSCEKIEEISKSCESIIGKPIVMVERLTFLRMQVHRTLCTNYMQYKLFCMLQVHGLPSGMERSHCSKPWEM